MSGMGTIGIAISAASNPYLATVVSAMEANVARRGSMMLLGETHDAAEPEYQLITALLARRVDGVVLAAGAYSVARTLPALSASGVPTVLVDRFVVPSGFDQVGSDNHEPVAAAVDHLVAHGHRRIAFVAGLPGLPTTSERQHGFRMGLLRNGLTTPSALIVSGGSNASGAQRAMHGLATMRPAPTAVITGNNHMPVGALTYLAGSGIRVPEDMALIAFDDVEWAELMRTPLTAIAQDWTAIDGAIRMAPK